MEIYPFYLNVGEKNVIENMIIVNIIESFNKWINLYIFLQFSLNN